MSDTWSGDWRTRATIYAQSVGHDNIFDFVMGNKRYSFGKLFGILRDATIGTSAPIAFVQLAEFFFMEAEKQGRLRDAIMEALVRSLQQFAGKGWGRGEKSRKRLLDARTNWPFPSLGYERWVEFQGRVWKELESIPPPSDWCPESYEDPLIQQVFARVWPIDRKTPNEGRNLATQ